MNDNNGELEELFQRTSYESVRSRNTKAFRFLEALLQRLVLDSGFIGNLYERFFRAVSGNGKARVSFVQLLLTSRSPMRILRGVISINVASVYRMIFRRRSPHIGKKVFKLFPSCTDGDATAAVVLKSFVKRIVAAVLHGLPCNVLLAGIAPSCFSVRGQQLFQILAFMRAATNCSSKVQIGCSGNTCCAAITKTVPHALTHAGVEPYSGWGFNQKPAKPFSYQVNNDHKQLRISGFALYQTALASS